MGLARGLVVGLLLPGCQTLFGIDKDPEKAPDAGLPTADARECWGTDVSICVRPPASEPRTLSGTLDTGSQCTGVENDLCIVAGTDVTIGDLRVFGPRPLVVVASGKLTVTGPLDAASHRTGANPTGPGATAPACGAFVQAPTFVQSGGSGGGAGGGAGGTFVGVGGNGGASVGGALVGTAVAAITPAFRAGCAGQAGGTRATLAAAGGKGGGALYLISTSQIEVSGVINASGAAGDSGKCVTCAPDSQPVSLQSADAYGGGGGGSGGAIVLEAPQIAITQTGRVFADGGGGGQGASRSSAGEVGAEPTGTAAALGGRGADDGGTGPNNGGNGGPGSYAATKAGTIGAPGESSNPGGGGGGGGGAGYVKTIGALTSTGTISPAP